ncbi:MAG: 2-C-methyl-D-erythritol 4-phosphate cytidylyltransferase [Paracoccaceae bacterium]|jgi:2-C-methyl-D-erythritol 4-phosphate cytidylyltransferase/2-C-methyl-D-erythritol 2,4-cyclodiphosphate synthase
MTHTHRIAAIIVAAGRGTRAGGRIPKQYQPLAGVPVLQRTLAAFCAHPRVDEVLVVTHPDDADLVTPLLPDGVACVTGGATRGASVAAGLSAVSSGTSHVLIHDAARPLVSVALINRVIDALAHAPGAAPGVMVTDALWHAQAGVVTAPHPRDGLWRAQTPQGFALAAIRAAHAAYPGQAADDVEVALAAGLEVRIVEGEETNLKLTHAEDFARASQLLKDDAQMDIRTGTGFDVHRFGPGDAVMLCGVNVPHERGLVGHSDADVGLHTITDAIYGALAEGDIGRHFPPSDPQWKGAQSHIFLRHAVGLAQNRGFRISNIDATLVCEFPKIGPHADAMRAAVAAITETAIDRISIKATTSERLGFTGREEGIACIATVTLVSP